MYRLFCAALLSLTAARGQTAPAPDLTKDPTLYVVGYAHLDTQYRWELPRTIGEFLLKTMRVNFDYFEKYPHYIFNWTGANRYRLMKEYFPADYAKVTKYVAAGRWFPAGSSVEEGDVNSPTAEGILRQILYGNAWFRKDFGLASEEYMLPDCFGFPAALPSILAHAGIKGFSTQKLSAMWQPAPHIGGPDSPEKTPDGIPFNVGRWIGPDGKTVIAALNPLTYMSSVTYDLSKTPPPPTAPPAAQPGRNQPNEDWVQRVNIDGQVTGLFADYHYVGTGDTGGAPSEPSVKLMEEIATKSDGPLHVEWSKADQMFRDILRTNKTGKLVTYQGDLELINHSAGSLTSQAYHKRWSRHGEILADAAERASVAAAWLGARSYPQDRLNAAWVLVLSGQFHDTMAGTATPKAFEYAWNDDVIAMNQFAGILTSAIQATAAGMNTDSPGVPIVVYNPLNIPREDVVEAELAFPGGTPKAVRVTGPGGRAVPAQIEGGRVLFLAKAPSVGYAVYHVEPASTAAASPELKVTPSSIENARYSVTIDNNGDVSSIRDKALGRELLSAPVRLAITTDAPRVYPAWNMDWDQVHAAPRAYVSGPANVRVVENGPVRVAVEVSREAEGSRFGQTVSLSAGDAGSRVEFHESIDWRGKASNLKVTFPLAASNEKATYNQEIGAIERPTEEERQFEVGSHHWIDLTDSSGSWGATILTGAKNGSDKYDDHTLRLTLVRTPGPPEPSSGTGGGRRGNTDQFNQDWGHHEIVFGIAGHKGDWREAQTDWQGYRLSEPLMAFETSRHPGALGREFSAVRVSNPRVRVMALKKAEAGDEVVLRLVEIDGKPQTGVRINFPGAITSAREIDGQERPIGPATLLNGALVADFARWQPRTFAVKLAPGARRVPGVRSAAVRLPCDRAVASNDDTKTVEGFDDQGNALPAEMLPASLRFHDVFFALAPAGTGKKNAVVAHGQTIPLPVGRFNRVYVLAASGGGDRKVVFRAGERQVELTIQDWGGFIGQWDTRVWKPAPETVRRDWAVSANHAVWKREERSSPNWSPRFPEDYLNLEPGFIKRADVAWYASHHHTAAGLNEPYQYSYLFAYGIDLPAGAKTLTLPDDSRIRILAVSAADEGAQLHPVQALYDVLGR